MEKSMIPEISIYHIGEIFLYEYYINGNEYRISSEDRTVLPLSQAESYEQKGEFQNALEAYKKAYFYNPVSMTINTGLIRCYRKLNLLKEMYTQAVDCFKFCCTRAEVAMYYRSLGYYYLSCYNPDLSAALYRYSTFFYKSDTAENEIKYLETAMGHKYVYASPDEIRTILRKNNIPEKADSVTLALLVRAGEEAEDKMLLEQALECYKMVYDLSQDEYIMDKIKKLNEKEMV